MADRLWQVWDAVKVAYVVGAILLVAVLLVVGLVRDDDAPSRPATTTEDDTPCDGPDAAEWCGDLHDPPEYVPGEGGW